MYQVVPSDPTPPPPAVRAARWLEENLGGTARPREIENKWIVDVHFDGPLHPVDMLLRAPATAFEYPYQIDDYKRYVDFHCREKVFTQLAGWAKGAYGGTYMYIKNPKTHVHYLDGWFRGKDAKYHFFEFAVTPRTTLAEFRQALETWREQVGLVES